MRGVDARRATRYVAALALALSALACRSAREEAPKGAAPTTAAPVAAPAATPPVAAPAAQPAVEPNRDVHGGKDVAQYIGTLEGDKRVAEMRPDFVVGELALKEDAVVADLGCGPGVFSLRFARACPRGVVYAVDIEPRQLDRLREHLLAEHVENVVPVLCSASTPHLPPASCDLIFVADTYHHFDDRVAYMQRLKKALRPGGRVAIFEYKPGQLPVGPPPDHKLKDGELVRELDAAGYELVTDFRSHEYHDFQIWKPRS